MALTRFVSDLFNPLNICAKAQLGTAKLLRMGKPSGRSRERVSFTTLTSASRVVMLEGASRASKHGAK